MPIPAPKYKNSACIVGAIFVISIFENGTLIAYSIAARTANKVASSFITTGVNRIRKRKLLQLRLVPQQILIE